MTCLAMYGSGARIGMEITLKAAFLILRGLKMARCVLFAVAVGRASRPTAGRRCAGARPAAAATSLVSGFVFRGLKRYSL